VFSGSMQIGVPQGNYVMDVTGGNWKVVVEQPLYGSGTPVPTHFSGRGETATAPMLVRTQSLVRFHMQHDGPSNFAIWLLDADGNREDLLVNEIGPFTGTKGIPLAPGVYVMHVMADGNWSVGIS
ncbi:MAG TPA: hypothetical protein VG795_13555, partial [Acidimicrobiia bacterium]|nr:hypothetical protein [Acidimicrobiia bacterium]